ncbi:MAG: cobamide remodeling phosphodiesterase CbiR [Desulfosalsimonas sp.]
MTDHKTDNPENGLPYKPLSKSYRNRFPFTLAAPSFIYPDHVLPNVRMLAPFIDEIELVLFESSPDESLPPAPDIKALAGLSQSEGISYNIHLPIDVKITDQDTKKRADAIDRIANAVERAQMLEPSTWTLHLPYTGNAPDPASVNQWQNMAGSAVETLLKRTLISPRLISIETLDFPPAWLEPVARDLDLSVCLDTGHLMEHGRDITEAFKLLGDRISIIHLYGGVKQGRGHVGLEHLPERLAPAVSGILRQFTGIVSLEVFSRNDLEKSLEPLVRLAMPETKGEFPNV